VSDRHDKRNDSCVSFADDFDAVARFVEKETGVADYVQPVLVGWRMARRWRTRCSRRRRRGRFAADRRRLLPTLAFSRPVCPGNACVPMRRCPAR